MVYKETESDSDDYYDLIEFTQQDLARIDAATTTTSGAGDSSTHLKSIQPLFDASQNPQTQTTGQSDSTGGPSIVIEYETSDIDLDEPKARKNKSLYETYRFSKRRDFSVSDLVAPAW
jgi:hypothetical protein